MMKMEEILKVFAPHRGDAIVISGRANRHWDKISTIPNRDLSLGDPAMGGHAGFALGLAHRGAERLVVGRRGNAPLLLADRLPELVLQRENRLERLGLVAALVGVVDA